MKKPKERPVALVTGGGGGIGRETSLEFARAGYRVAVCDHQLQAATETTDAIHAEGGHAEVYAIDVADPAKVRDMIDAIRRDFGRLDAAFNNAGQSSLLAPLAEISHDDWDRVLRTNLTGTFICMKYEIMAMLDQGSGCIVNNSSMLGVRGGISASYTASKHGVCGLTKSAAITYAQHGLRINAVCPGLIEAGMGLKVLARAQPDPGALIAASPIRRSGTASEVARAVVWLCSDSASYIHGHMLAVDGGFCAR